MKKQGEILSILLCVFSAPVSSKYITPLAVQDFGPLFTDKYIRNETLLDLTDYEPVIVATKAPLNPLIYDINGKPENWQIQKAYKGYQMKSDSLPMRAQTFKLKNQQERAIRIRIGKVGSARYVEGKYRKRVLELKITTWDRISHFRIKVPEGVEAQNLKIIEGSQYVDVYAPVNPFE